MYDLLDSLKKFTKTKGLRLSDMIQVCDWAGAWFCWLLRPMGVDKTEVPPRRAVSLQLHAFQQEGLPSPSSRRTNAAAKRYSFGWPLAYSVRGDVGRCLLVDRTTRFLRPERRCASLLGTTRPHSAQKS